MTRSRPSLICKVCNRAEGHTAQAAGVYEVSQVDLEDGFIHFSTAQQLRETTGCYFAGLLDLVLVEVNLKGFGDALKWEPSRGGDLFPHLYAELPLMAVVRTWDLPLGEDGLHRIPAELGHAHA